MQTDLKALGPFKLTPTSSKDEEASGVLSKEKTLVVAKVLFRYELKLKQEVRQENVKTRRSFYSGQNWPYYEEAHDRLL